MKNKDILNALGGIDPEFIADAEKFNAEKYNGENTAASVKKTPRIEWKKWTLAAACVCLAVIMVAALLPKLWTDPTPPTPSGSDIFYNENGELDEKLIFANLSQVVWDTSVTSPEEEKPLGQIYEWNGLRLEEELYNKLTTAGENDLFAVRVIYDGTALYERYSYFYEMNDAKEYLEQLKAEAKMLEEFKAEAEAFFTTGKTEDETKAFYDKCSEKYDVLLVKKFMPNGKYDSESVDKRLTELYKNIPDQNNIIDVNRVLLENKVLTSSHELMRISGLGTARLIDERVVIFASKRLLNLFLLNIKNVTFVDASEFIFALAPGYLAEKLEKMVDPPATGYYDPSENTSFAFSKLKFYSTRTEFTANLDVIKEMKRCYDYYDDLTFTVTYSGKIPAEKLEAMKYSSIEQSSDGSTVTVTVNYEDFDSEALKKLSRDTNVWRIFVSYPEGAEMGFGKNKIYFGYPGYDFTKPEILSVGKELVNDRDDIIERINRFPRYNNIDKTVNSKIVCRSRNGRETVIKTMERLGGNAFFNIKFTETSFAYVIYFYMKTETFNEYIDVIKSLSHMSEISSMKFELDTPNGP